MADQAKLSDFALEKKLKTERLFEEHCRQASELLTMEYKTCA